LFCGPELEQAQRFPLTGKSLLFLKKKKQKDSYLLAVSLELAFSHTACGLRRKQKSFCSFFFRNRRIFLSPTPEVHA
jgi:hypothetical protein